MKKFIDNKEENMLPDCFSVLMKSDLIEGNNIKKLTTDFLS